MIFQYINVCPVPREMLKTSAYGLGFQHLPRDLANVNAWKTMFDPYINTVMRPADADGMDNSDDPDQTAPYEQFDLGEPCLLRPICPNN